MNAEKMYEEYKGCKIGNGWVAGYFDEHTLIIGYDSEDEGLVRYGFSWANCHYDHYNSYTLIDIKNVIIGD